MGLGFLTLTIKQMISGRGKAIRIFIIKIRNSYFGAEPNLVPTNNAIFLAQLILLRRDR